MLSVLPSLHGCTRYVSAGGVVDVAGIKTARKAIVLPLLLSSLLMGCRVVSLSLSPLSERFQTPLHFRRVEIIAAEGCAPV